MPLVSSVDYANKRIYLSAETVGAEIDLIDVYKEVRALRRTNETHRKFKPMLVSGGNLQKTATTFTPKYVQLLYGCRIVPYDTSHNLILIREAFTDDGLVGHEVFDRTALSPTTAVDIDVNVQEVEIRLVSTGGSAVLPEDITAIRDAILNAVAVNYNTIGTIGNKINNASNNSNIIPALL